jgi:NADH-quinone oxidoreductase subunit F
LGEIRIGLGSCCVAQGSGKVREAIDRVLAETQAAAVVKRVGCVGMCHQTPLVEIVSASGTSKLYAKVTPESAAPVVLKHFRPRGLARRLGYRTVGWLDRLLTDEPGNPVVRHAIDPREGPVCAFLGPQRHLATEYCGRLDPTDLDEYLRHDGFKALQRSLEYSPERIIDEVEASGLRGRGGAGFPTARKWAAVREAPGEPKYIVCNGDEGDPGAFMDRMLLESFPYRIIEGMAIAARAVGAEEGVFYIRAEYPLAVERITEALRECERRGLLGDSVMGQPGRLRLSLKQGAGAFVCGEETALLASIEGRRGMPRLRPPYPAQNGLGGKPTLVNNVETYALLPWILRHGAGQFAALGTAKSKGTKVFALAGKVRRGGLIEVPMGVTVRQIVDEIGGGVAEGRQFKAVQVGGPSGGCVPAELADTTVDYEALSEVGAIMGSGGLVVLDDSDCMVDIARYFLEVTQDQSCGKCTFCRIGTRRMLDILTRICEGSGKSGDLGELEELAVMVKAGSICGLGKTAPNPVLSTLRYFREEYEAHLAGRCPAGRCKALVRYRITDDCIGCTLCAQHCPADAISMAPYIQHRIDLDKCTRCDTCRQVCPADAVVVESGGV